MKTTRKIFIIITTLLVASVMITNSFAAGPEIQNNETSPISSPDVDLSGASHDIRLLSHVGGSVIDVVARNNRLYTGFSGEFSVLDPSTPGSPHRIGYTILRGEIREIALVGNNAFTAIGSGGMAIVNISDAAHPTELSTLDTPGDGYGIAVGTGYAYIADGSQGVRIINIENLLVPYEAGSISSPDEVWDVYVHGNYLYVAEELHGLYIYDITAPANPVYVTNVFVGGDAMEISFVGDYLLLANNYMGLVIFNMRNPESPVMISTVEDIGYVFNVDIAWPYAYVTDGYYGVLYIVDITDLHSPQITGQYEYWISSTIRSTAIIGHQAFVAGSDRGLHLVDITDPTSPFDLGTYDPIGSVSDLALWQNTLYLAMRYVTAIDVTNPSVPGLLGIGHGTGRAQSVGAAGGYTYSDDSSWWPSHLNVMDFTNRAEPVLVNTIETNQPMNDFKIAGGYGYIADYDLEIADLADPANPIIIGNYHPIDTVNALVVRDDYVYLAAGERLIIVDATDKQNPAAMGQEGIAYDVRGIDVEGNYAYAAWTNYDDIGGGFSIVDISDPYNPVEMSQVLTTWGTYGIAVDGNLLFLGAGNQGLLMFDISNKSNPVQVGYYERCFGGDLVYENGVIYLAAKDGGVFLLEPLISTISGWVRGPNYAPITGDTILMQNETTATDQDGAYQFRNRLPGTYTITPVNPDGVYVPAYRDVTVPPDQTYQTFYKLPLPATITVTPGITTTLSYTDLQGLETRVTFPPNAVSDMITVTIEPSMPLHFGGFSSAGHAFNLLIEQNGSLIPDFTFNAPVNISIDYSDYDIRNVTNEETIVLWWMVSDILQDASMSCDPPSNYYRDTNGNRIEVPVCRSGSFSLAGPTMTVLLPIATNE